MLRELFRFKRPLAVQLRGRAGLLYPGPEQATALAALRAKYAQYADMPLDDASVIRLTVEDYAAWGRP